MKVRELAQSATADLGVGSPLLAYKWVNDRYKELVATKPIKPFRKVYELVVPAVITAGTISTTQDSKVVTGNSTAAAAWGPFVVDRYFRADGSSEWYRIANVSGTTLTLESPFVESDVSAESYTIVARNHTLAANLRHIGVMVNMHLGLPLVQWPLDKLNRLDPLRSTTSGGPHIYTELAVDDEWRRTVELYPPDTSDRLLMYTGYETPRDLGPEDTIPDFIDPHILREGVLMNIYQREAMDQMRQGNTDASGIAANLAARQRTIWNEMRGRFIRDAEATDDKTFLLQGYGGRTASGLEIISARDHVYSGWSPLTS